MQLFVAPCNKVEKAMLKHHKTLRSLRHREYVSQVNVTRII